MSPVGSRMADVLAGGEGQLCVEPPRFAREREGPDSLRVFGRLPVTDGRACTEAGVRKASRTSRPPAARSARARGQRARAKPNTTTDSGGSDVSAPLHRKADCAVA